MRLIFPKPRHPGLQFEHKNKTIPIRVRYDFLKLALQVVIAVAEKPDLACSSLPPIFPFNVPDFPQGQNED